MSEPTSSRILPWVQAVGFAAGAAAAAVVAVSLRDRSSRLTSWLGKPGREMAAEISLPDSAWLYAGAVVIAFLSGLVLWRKLAATPQPLVLTAFALGGMTAGFVLFAMIAASMAHVSRAQDPVVSLALPFIPIILMFMVGWKLIVLGGLWGLVWGGLWTLASRSFWTWLWVGLRSSELKSKIRTEKSRPATWD